MKGKKVTRLEGEAKKLVPEKFHKWIYIFGKKASERMPTRKLWNYTINMKERFVLRKGKIYIYCQEKKERRCTSSFWNN